MRVGSNQSPQHHHSSKVPTILRLGFFWNFQTVTTTYVITLRQAQEGPVVHLTPGDLAFEAFVVHGAPGQHLLGQRVFCETGGSC
jgi:hypothetical protein